MQSIYCDCNQGWDFRYVQDLLQLQKFIFFFSTSGRKEKLLQRHLRMKLAIVEQKTREYFDFCRENNLIEELPEWFTPLKEDKDKKEEIKIKKPEVKKEDETVIRNKDTERDEIKLEKSEQEQHKNKKRRKRIRKRKTRKDLKAKRN